MTRFLRRAASCWMLLAFCSLFVQQNVIASDDNDNWSLGPIGGTFRVQAGTNYLEVKSVEGSGPGGTAGLQVGDYIYKAYGVAFRELSANRTNGYKGSVQDLAIAIERAESGNGSLDLTVLRPGTGDVDLTITLPVAGAFGPAYPLGSTKFDAMYQWGCAEIHSQTTASADANFGYDTGFYGLILIAHPNWNDTTGDKPYRLSVDKLKDWCVSYLQGRITSPVEALNLDGTPNDGSEDDSNPNDQSYVSPGLENWTIGTAAMYLAEYRRKTGDSSLDADLQNASTMLTNRIHTHTDYEGQTAGWMRFGRMGHAGLGGHYGNGALNIINAHAMPALAMLKAAGATVDDTRFQSSWGLVGGATNTGDHSDNGAVGYMSGGGGGYDSMGRTAGVAYGMEAYGGMSPADQAIVDTQKEYVWRQWERMQHTHAYTVGGVVFTQFILPYLEDRQQRYLMENQRLFYHFSRNTAGTLSYFGGRYNNGGDGYLNLNRVAIMNVCMAQAVASGNLQSFPSVNTARLHADFISPALTWPSIDARYLKTTTGSVDFSNINITDYLGSVLNTSDYTATWSHVSGPATATFSNTSAINPTVTFPSTGRYKIQLQVVKGGYTLTEPIEVDYFPGTVPNGYTAGTIKEEIYSSFTGDTVADLTAHASYPSSPTSTRSITSIEGTESSNNYGTRISGHIIAPVTGDYTFYVSADNNAEFYLSTDADEANKSKICYTTTWTDAYEWDQNPEQTSTVKSLTAGQAYYFEVLHKAQSGGDHVAVAWTFPGIATPQVISSEFIATQGSGATTVVSHPQAATVAAGDNVTMSVTVTGEGPFLYQWRKDGVAYWPASASANLELTNVGAGAAGDYDCVITAPDGTVTSNTGELTVTGVGVLTSGGLWRDVFSEIGGNNVSDLTTLVNYPYFPDSGSVITSTESPANEANTYGSRWTGWLKPDETGAHIFYLTADDTAELWLSTDDQPANAVKIASLTRYSSYRDWDGGAISAGVNLVSGNRYYIEVRHKEGSGGDHCSVAWKKPSEAVPADGTDAAIPSQYLEYLTGGVYFTHTSVSLSRVTPASDSVKIRPSVGLELECSASTTSANAAISWAMQSGPGVVTFTDASSLATRATFSAEGNYLLRCTYDNGGVPATYDMNVEVTSVVSSSWSSASISEPTAGSGVVNPDGSITVQGSGDDIYSTSDEGHLFYQTLTGDFDVRARVASKTVTNGFGTHAQLHARASSDSNSKNVALTHEQTETVAFQYRSTAGNSTNYEAIPASSLPTWIRLVRSGGNPATGTAGQTFTGYYSTDSGATWIQRETYTFTSAMPDALLVGFAVSSGGNSLNTAIFDNVSGFALAENVSAEPNAGTDFTTSSLSAQALAGSSVDEGLPATPGSITNAWTQVSGPGTASFADAAAANTTVSFTLPGTYVLRLTSDDGSAKTYDEVTVTAVADFTVSIAATDDSAEGNGSATGEFTVTRTGATTSALTVNLAIGGSATSGTDYTAIANTVEIPELASSVTITVTSLFDAVQEGVETVEIGVAPGNYNSVTTAAVVNITNAIGVNAPTLADATHAVDENLPIGTTVGTVGVMDSDVGETYVFSITAGNTGFAFAIDNFGVITTNAILDRETLASYVLTVEATDSGLMSDTATITVNVNDVHEAPVASADVVSLNANAASGVVDVLTNDDVNGGSTATLLGFANEAVVYDAGTSGSPQSPTASGWTETDTEDSDVSTGSLTAGASANHNGSGLDAWRITDNTNSGVFLTYNKAPTTAEIAQGNSGGWVLQTKMQFIDDFNDSNSVYLSYANGSTRFLVFFDLDGNDDLTAQLIGTGGGTYTLTTGGTGAAAFHDIEMLYDPATSSASFIVDGVRHDTGSWTGQGSSDNGAYFATGSSGGQGSAALHLMKWSYFDTTGTLASGATVSASGSDVTFSPNGGYDSLTAAQTANEVISYAMTDGEGHFTLGELTVTIQGVDDLPAFDSDPVVAATANIIYAYTGVSLASFGGDPDDAHTFSKVSGPTWLSVAADGTLTGSPTSSDLGLNSFTVAVSNGKAESAQTTLEITVDSTISIFAEDFESYDVENPSDLSVGGTATGYWTSSNTASNATRIYSSGNFGGTRLWISNIDGTSLTSAGITVDSNAHYELSSVLVTETSTGSRTLNATYDILVGQDAATATSIIGGPQAVVTHGDNYQGNDSKTDHVFTNNFQTSTLTAGDKLFVRFTRVGILSSGGWFGVDDVQVDQTGVNTAPVASDAVFAVNENVASGTAVGMVPASDANLHDSLNYVITAGNTGGAFAIDAGTGAITTTSVIPDYESLSSYALTVTVTDGSAQSDTASITVNVNDAFEDLDSDGLDDTWETTNYPNLAAVSKISDTDGDGFTAFEEMVFGMDPTVNDSSVAPIQDRIVNDEGTDKLEVKFRRPQNYATLNVDYVLQSCDDLQSASWAKETTVTPATTDDGTNEWVTYLMPLPSGAETRKFYRCQVLEKP